MSANKSPNDYRIEVAQSMLDIPAEAWNGLLAVQSVPTPFMRHEYLSALETSESATTATGWTPQVLTMWAPLPSQKLLGACVIYLKTHSYGEYVFDWAWARAYQEHGLPYYPKAVLSVPFTPVPGSRLLAIDAERREQLLAEALRLCEGWGVSSLHLLFGSAEDMAVSQTWALMPRHTVQFHWLNRQPEPYRDFDDFLNSLNQEKRKKIRQERRKVTEAGVTFRWAQGSDISPTDWAFFYQCYERTYLEHGNAPYLSRAFFEAQAALQPESWLLFIAERDQKPIASSLIGLLQNGSSQVAYGRYWGALERVDCLHFEACYYQPLAWCIAHQFDRFEGGAQGEHKMARALMPVNTSSAHWLAHPAFAEAVGRFLERETEGVSNYLEHLNERNPFKQA